MYFLSVYVIADSASHLDLLMLCTLCVTAEKPSFGQECTAALCASFSNTLDLGQLD